MIWLTWRQFRTQAAIALGALVLIALYAVYLGLAIRNFYDANVVGCGSGASCEGVLRQFRSNYKDQIDLIGVLLIAAPAIMGIFWGAPLITKELEAGTHRLVWSQSITRARWLFPKAGLISLASIVVAGVFSLLVTWAVRPYDRAVGGQFTKLVFDSRNIAPLGYALFAFMLGLAVGMLLKRTLPAMAVTLVVFVLLQLVMPFLVRPHLIPPKEATIEVNETTLPRVGSFLIDGPDEATGSAAASTITVEDYGLPGALVLTSSSKVLTETNQPATFSGPVKTCLDAGQTSLAETGACLTKQNLHFDVSYQPASRYWIFQWVETGVFVVLALLLLGVARWRIPRIS